MTAHRTKQQLTLCHNAHTLPFTTIQLGMQLATAVQQNVRALFIGHSDLITRCPIGQCGQIKLVVILLVHDSTVVSSLSCQCTGAGGFPGEEIFAFLRLGYESRGALKDKCVEKREMLNYEVTNEKVAIQLCHV